MVLSCTTPQQRADFIKKFIDVTKMYVFTETVGATKLQLVNGSGGQCEP